MKWWIPTYAVEESQHPISWLGNETKLRIKLWNDSKTRAFDNNSRFSVALMTLTSFGDKNNVFLEYHR